METNMEHPKVASVFVGIDCHKKSNIVAIGKTLDLEKGEHCWRRLKVKPVSNNRKGFDGLKSAIDKAEKDPAKVAIAVDLVAYYSEPLTHFLVTNEYHVYHLEPKAIKASRQRLLDIEDKTDRLDARAAAYLLYLRQRHNSSFRITEVKS
jgi:hypothetical protein